MEKIISQKACMAYVTKIRYHCFRCEGYSRNQLSMKLWLHLSALLCAIGIFPCAVSSAITDGHPSDSYVEAATKEACGNETLQPLCQLCMRPPKVLGEKASALLHSLGLGPMLRIPLLVFGFWGYPDFPGISQESPMGMFLLPSKNAETGYHWILCIRAEDGSPIHATFASQELALKRVDDWTFVAQSEDTFVEFSDDNLLRSLRKRVVIANDEDFSIRFFSSAIDSYLKNYEQIVLQNLLELGRLDDYMQGISLINLGLNFVRQLDSLCFSLRLRDDHLDVGGHWQAKEGSDLALLLNAPIDWIDAASVARFLPSEGACQILFRYNPDVLKILGKYVADAFYTYGKAQPIGSSRDQDAYSFIDNLFANDGGAVALCTTDNGEGFESIWKISASPEQLAQWVDFAHCHIVPIFLHSFGAAAMNSGDAPQRQVVHRAFYHRGKPVTRSGISGDTAGSVINYYYCSLENFIAITNSDASMRQLIDGVHRKKLSSSSLEDLFPLSPRMSLRARIRGDQFARYFVPTFSFVHGGTCIYMEIDAQQGNDSFYVRCTVPIALLKELLEIITADE
jgi:hypothetical protein